MNNWTRNIAAALALCTSGFAFAGPVNINTADAATIAKELHGVGKAKAELIVAYREAHGAFTAPEQLVKVKGVGKRTLDQNREDIRL